MRKTLTLRRTAAVQVGLLAAFWLTGEALAQLTGLPLPGGVIGLGIVVLLLATRRLRVDAMKRGADWLITEMLLFFVPAVLAVLDHRELIGPVGLKALLVILVSTMAVMMVTALTVDLCCRWRRRHEHPGPGMG